MNAMPGASPPTNGAWRAIAALGGAMASVAAGAVAAVLAVVFTAALAAVAVMGMALVGLTATALRRRRAPRADGADLIEARPLGGHRWVAYGWDQDGRRA